MRRESRDMNSKIFIDTDVIIDVLIDRQPHAKAATQIFDLAERKKLDLYTSSLCLNNVHYITKKILGDKRARVVIGDLIEIINVLSVSKSDILNAVNSNFRDFEDAIQHSVALTDNNIKSILTRNIKDYTKAKIAVFTPEMLIQILKKDK